MESWRGPGRFTRPSSWESPADLLADIKAAGSRRDITVKRTKVANQKALVTTYTRDRPPEAGGTAYMEGYMFIGPSKQVVSIVFGRTTKRDTDFVYMSHDILASIKLTR